MLLQRRRQSKVALNFASRPSADGIDIALHDVCGKALGVPIHRLYGGALRQLVPVYASGLCYFPDVDPATYCVEEARELVERGFVSGIKMRIGRFEPGHELPLIARVRECLPPRVKLMVDAWGSYTPPVALRVGRELERLGVYWYEEPLPQAGYAGYAELCAGSGAHPRPRCGRAHARIRHHREPVHDARAGHSAAPARRVF
jgi:D-galactarolactone cycloisomerase